MRTVFSIVWFRYKQFGGLKVVRYYIRMGAVWPMVKRVIRNPFSRQTYKDAYREGIKKIEPFLYKKYGLLMPERKAYYASLSLEHKKNKIIWFCWLQGIEQAPQIVKVCYASIVHYLPDRVIKVIDGNNWSEYVELPDYILEKWNKKQIPPAHFSDLLRVQLLIRYGGTWIDSTVLCTGLTLQNKQLNLSYLDADLFMFQYTHPESLDWGGIGNWFISSSTNNEVLLTLRDMLFAYWRDYDCLLDYYIFHLFFSMLREVYFDEISAMPYGFAPRNIFLGYHWDEQFNKQKWDKLASQVCFHKLSYNVRDKVERTRGNYYHHIVDSFLKQ